MYMSIDLQDYVTGIENDGMISIATRTNLVKHFVSDCKR